MVRHLLEYTDASVRICGRRLDKADALQRDLQGNGAGERITVCRADAGDPASLRQAYFKDRRSIDFGERFGRRQAFPIDMAELHALPEKLGIEELSVYGGSPNWIADYLTSSLIGGLHKIRARLGWPILARLVFWMAKNRVDEPAGCSTVLDAWGERDGQDCTARWVVDHEDNYFATAVAVTAFLNQYDAGIFDGITGVRMMGHIIDPESSVQDLRSMGVTVREGGESGD